MKRYKKCHIVDIVLDSEHQVRSRSNFTMTEMNFPRINEPTRHSSTLVTPNRIHKKYFYSVEFLLAYFSHLSRKYII